MRELILLKDTSTSCPLTEKGMELFCKRTGMSPKSVEDLFDRWDSKAVAFRSHPILLWMVRLNNGVNPFVYSYLLGDIEEFDETKYTAKLTGGRTCWYDEYSSYEELELVKKVEKSTIKKLIETKDVSGMITYLRHQGVNITDS